MNMPITTTCAGCKSLFRLPDELAGKQVRCQKCAQMFVVPLPVTGMGAVTVSAPEKPAPPQETPPAQPVPQDDMAPVTLAAPPDDVVLATLAPETPKDDIVLATLAPAPAASVKPPPPPPERPPSVLGGLVLVLLFLMGVFATGAFATLWLATHLTPPMKITSAPPLHGVHLPNQNFKKKDDLVNVDKFWDKKDWGEKEIFNEKKHPLIQAEPIFLGFDNTAVRNHFTEQAPFVEHGKWNQDGPYRLYTINLKEGIAYNFHLQGQGFEPRLRIVDDGKFLFADDWGKEPHHRVMVTIRPNRTGDFLLWVSGKDKINGVFSLNIAQEKLSNPVKVDLTQQPSFTEKNTLRVEDPLDVTGVHFGPFREYDLNLVGGTDYVITIENVAFTPVLRVDNNKALTQQDNDKFARRITYALRRADHGKYRLRVTSEWYALGAYTLKVEAKSSLQRIVVQFDEKKGAYMSRREFVASDPQVPGRGSYHEYLVELEQGKKYRIEMSQGNAPTALMVFTPSDGQLENRIGMKETSVTFAAGQAGLYRLRVFAPLPKDRAEYTVRITTEP